MNALPLEAVLEAAVRTATPLALAALGETVTQRSGVINLSLEGILLAGAFGATVGATAGVAGGVGLAMASGMVLAAVFAGFAISVRADQIITGTAITLLSIGLTGALYRTLYGASGAALSIPTMRPVSIPVLSDIPILGRALFMQTPFTYLVYLLLPAMWWWLYRTGGGLALRAIGDAPEAAEAAGIRRDRLRAAAILFGGLLGGAAGAALVLAQTGTFAEGMSAGRGFIAIAIVVLGRWHPIGAGLAALVFGSAMSVQFSLQSMGWDVPYQLFLLLPYALTLILLAGLRRHAAAPLSLGRP